MKKLVMILLVCVLAGCGAQTTSDDDEPYNGAKLVSPYVAGSMVRVDDGFNQCYILWAGTNPTMSCVRTDKDNGSDDRKDQQ